MSWPLKSLSELCLLAVDCVNKTAPIVDYPTPYRMIRTTNVKRGFIDVDTVRYVTEETFQSWTRRSQPRFGDVILTREAPVGEVGRCTFDDDKNIFLGQRLFLYRPDPELLDWNYLAYVLQSPLMQSKLHGMSFGATVPHIKVGYAENLEIPCPSLDIQKSIGSLLAAYDDLIEVNRRRICLLEESARLLYREWFVNLRFPGCELVRRTEGIPEGWSRERLDSALLLQRGFDLPNGVRKPGNIPIYASAGINGYHNEAKVKGPGIVTGRSGTLGLVHYVSGDFWPLNTALWVKEFRRVTPLFAYFMLSEMNLAQYNSGASVPSLDRKVVHPVEILIPPERVIGQFGEYVEPLFEQVEYLREANLRAAEARDALLPKLMSGAIQV